MMALSPDRPPLIPTDPNGIPLQMRQTARWAPWRAEWNPKGNKGQGKYEKIPHRWDRPESGLSNKTTKGWTTFDNAMRAYRSNPERFAGVGYIMTEQEDITGIDLDHCVENGVPAPWAAKLVADLQSYTEVSVSGTGLHVIVAGHLPEDWANHEQGVEVYAGNKARFLAITGAHVGGTPTTVQPLNPNVLDTMAARWRPKFTAAQILDLHLPPLLPATELPEVEDLDLPAYVRNFLLEGPGPGDRSRQLINAATALAQSGLEREVVFSMLEANEYALEVALDHRSQDYDKALRFIWDHSAQAGAARAEKFRQLQVDEFDDLGAEDDLADILGSPSDILVKARTGTAADDFDDLGPGEDNRHSDLAPAKVPRFTPVDLGAFLQRKQPSWIVKGVVPRAGLAIIYGASGSGKTFFTMDLACAVARGVEWRGMKAEKGRVVYIVAEGAGGFRNRVAAYCEQHGIAPGDIDLLVIPDTPNFLDKTNIKELIAALKKVGPIALIIVDTYARVMAGGNENDAKDTGQAVAHCDLLHRVFKALVVLVHHSGKDATKGARGSGALRAAADLEIEVIQTRQYRAATVTKMKDGEDGKEYAFRLLEVVLGADVDGFPITSCVVEHTQAVPKHERKDEPKGDVEKTVYRYLVDITGLDESPVERELLIESTYTMLDFDPSTDKKDRRKEAVKRALDSLARKKLLTDDGFTITLL